MHTQTKKDEDHKTAQEMLKYLLNVYILRDISQQF